MPAKGYFYTFVTNQSAHRVYYNNLKITRQRGTLNNYYPFGLMWDNPDAMPNATYQGKEFQTNTFSDGSELALYDFGARMYDPVLGRWHCADPMYQFDSPYNAMANNPVVNIDPDGMWSIPWGNIMSAIGGFLSSIKETTTQLVGYVHHTRGIDPVYSSSTTQPLSGLGTAVSGAAMLLQAGLDGKKIQDAAGEIAKGVASNQGNLQPPQTQQEFDRRFYQDYKFRVDTEIRNEYSNLTPNATNPTSYPTKQEVVDMLNISLVDPKLYLKEVDPATNDIVAGFEYRVVEYEIYEFDEYRGIQNAPTYEVNGTRENIILDNLNYRSKDDPLFQIPAKNSSNRIRERMMEFNFYDPSNGYRRMGYRISFTFQLVLPG
jgi:RHS repeat-associated protein